MKTFQNLLIAVVAVVVTVKLVVACRFDMKKVEEVARQLKAEVESGRIKL